MQRSRKPRVKMYKCPRCSLECYGLMTLCKHLTEVHEKFKCTRRGCHAVLTTKGNLNRHLLEHMLEDERKKLKYTCDYKECTAKFAYKSLLEQHKRRHSAEKIFFCTFRGCDRAFKSKGDLNQHGKIHDGKEFTCKFGGCLHKTNTKKNLQDHVKTRHIGLKCPMCDEVFFHRQTLRNHRRYQEH